MGYILSKKVLILAITTLMILVSFSSFTTGSEEKDDFPTSRSTHTVFVEVFSAQFCTPCANWNNQIYSIYNSGSYDFEYVEMIVYGFGGWSDILNYDAQSRASSFGVTAYPTSILDGDYERVVGGVASEFYTDVSSCENRNVADVSAGISVSWSGSAQLQVDISIQNNEASQYNGHIRAPITEITSRYTTATGGNFHFGFLDYAFDSSISIPAGGVYTDSITWDGNNHQDAHGNDFGDITDDNLKVYLAVFDNSGYCDETVFATPNMDTGPPEISNVDATPSIQSSGGNVEFTADVVDDVDVNEVKAVITYPDDTSINETMTPDTGDTYTYDSTFSTTGVYSYYIWTDDVNGNQNTSDVFTFEMMDPHITDLASNWNFVALSLNQSISKTDLIVKYNAGDHSWADAVSDGYLNDVIFGWDRVGQSYTFNNTLEPGYGYWVYAYNPCELWVPLMNTNSDDYITSLKQNWNLVGSPNDENISKDNLLIDGISWADAVTGGYVNNVVFGWDRVGQSYDFTNVLEPGYAYWMYAYLPCTLEH